MTIRDLCALLTAAAVSVLALTGGAAAQSQWQTVTGPNGSFTVEMPGPAAYEPVARTSENGMPYTIHQYLLPQPNNALYMVQTVSYPPTLHLEPRARLESLLDSYAKGLDGEKWTTISWAKHEGLDAVTAFGTSDKEDQRAYAVVKGQQLFDVEYFGPRGSGKSADVDRFINSLKITARPSLPPPGPFSSDGETNRDSPIGR